MNDTPTPLTDAEEVIAGHYTYKGVPGVVDADFARSLERQIPRWLPIDSAPKDGTHILVCIAGLPRSQGEAYWWSIETGPGGWQTWDPAEHKRTVYVMTPTHWMPLPEPPKA